MKEELKLIDNKINKCKSCGDMVEKFPSSPTVSIGKSNRLLILGEAPANNGWRKSGVAWYDINGKLLPSGKIMQKLLDIVDIKLEDTFFIEAVKCFPKDRKHLKKCINNCRQFLEKQLLILNPDIILLLGDSATKAILDVEYKTFSNVVGKYFYKGINNKKILLLPIYHPSPVSPKSYTGNIDIFNKLKETKVLK